MGLDEKHILKKSFQGILPDVITGRSKHPYRAPIKQSLLNEKPAEYAQEMLAERALKRAGLFDARKVTKLLQKVEATGNPSEVDSMALVGVLSSQLVYRQFVEDFPAKVACSVSPDLVVDRRTRTVKSVG
jgi:asparagine synthase (glutamine-hydrolysing)